VIEGSAIDYRLPNKKVSPMSQEIERKTLLILKIVRDSVAPVGARVISRRLQDYGITLSERAVRYHLRFMDERGLTELIGKLDGRVITNMGIEEIQHAMVRDKIGFVISRIEILSFRTTFDPVRRQGLIPMNISFLPRENFSEALKVMAAAFEANLKVSDLVAVAHEGQRIGDTLVPVGKVGFATVCSIVTNGVMLKNGIPMDSKFGGILQMRKGRPLRFVELIYYSGSSLDPSEAFIRGKMTSVREVIANGEGKILANFREIPAPCMEKVREIVSNLRKAGMNGVLVTGEIGEAVCQIPVDIHKVGMILIGGLNPTAAVHEAGIPIENHAMSTMLEYGNLRPFTEVYEEMSI